MPISFSRWLSRRSPRRRGPRRSATRAIALSSMPIHDATISGYICSAIASFSGSIANDSGLASTSRSTACSVSAGRRADSPAHEQALRVRRADAGRQVEVRRVAAVVDHPADDVAGDADDRHVLTCSAMSARSTEFLPRHHVRPAAPAGAAPGSSGRADRRPAIAPVRRRADHGDVRFGRRFVGGETAAVDDRKPQRREVVGRHDMYDVGTHARLGLRRCTGDMIVLAGQRILAGDGDLLDRGVSPPASRSACGSSRRRRALPDRDQRRGLEADVGRFERRSVAHQRRRDDDQHQRHGDLADDQHVAQPRAAQRRAVLAAQRAGQRIRVACSAGRSANMIVASAATTSVKTKTR